MTVVDMDKEYKISAKDFKSKAKFTPFEGKTVKGKPFATLVNGKIYIL